METIARLAVVALVVLPLVVLALRGTRRDPLHRAARNADAAHDEHAALTGTKQPDDADARRLSVERAVLTAPGDQPAQPLWPSRFSADMASWTAVSSRF